jgi:cytochrome c peroxidase
MAVTAPSPAQVALGQQIFFDADLSEPPGQSCATCHAPLAGFADPRPGPASEGAVPRMFGPRSAPSIAYAAFIPPLSATGDDTGYGGGLFWDGRARTLEQQARGPLLNPIEMNNPDVATVAAKISSAPYAGDFQAVFGQDVFLDAGVAFANALSAIAAFERLGITGRFTSKYDAYLAGNAQLTDSEARGLALFNSDRSGTGGGCAQCHLNVIQADGGSPLFTDFGYDNIGIPKNLANPFYALPPPFNPAGTDYLDNGLGGSIRNPLQFGRFKAPTLRNIALTAPYGHNGYFADLRSIIAFYSTRDVPDAGWDAPEVTANLNDTNLGDLGFSDQDIADLTAYLNTLTDGWF